MLADASSFVFQPIQPFSKTLLNEPGLRIPHNAVTQGMKTEVEECQEKACFFGDDTWCYVFFYDTANWL
jgi:hypothetical protein